MIDARRPTTGDPLDEVLAGLAMASTQAGDEAAPARATVVDVGGGSGTRAVPLALLGCRVSVIDASADALAILHRRADEAGVADRVTGRQADAHLLGTVVPDGAADLVLCHHLLEEVDDPVATLAAMARALRPGGTLSVVVTGRLGAVIAHTIAGRFTDAATILADPDGRIPPADPLRRRYDPDELVEAIAAAGLAVRSVTGVGGVAALATGVAWQAAAVGGSESAALDGAFSTHPVLRRLAPEVHVVATRTAPDAPAGPGA